MGEVAESEHPAYPFIKDTEILQRLGLDDNTSYYGTPVKARMAIGIELNRAERWFKTKTGWTFDENEDISDDKKSLMADCMFERICYFFYRRCAVIRLDLAQEFRIMSREAGEKADELMDLLVKDKTPHSEMYNYPDDSRMGKLIEEEE